MQFQYTVVPEDASTPNTPAKEEVPSHSADGIRLHHSANEVILDFFAGKQHQKRILLQPGHLKALATQLQTEIESYEAEHGSIKMPRKKQESLISELKRNLYRDKKVGRNLRIINPTRKKSKTRRKG